MFKTPQWRLPIIIIIPVMLSVVFLSALVFQAALVLILTPELTLYLPPVL